MSLRCNRNVLNRFLPLTLMLAGQSALAYSLNELKSVATPQEIEIDNIRDQEIQEIKTVIIRRGTDTRSPDLLLRLAELYIEKYRFYFFKENEYYQKLLKAGQRASQPQVDLSMAQLKLANNACKEILQSKIAFSKMDNVYYFLAYNAQELGSRAGVRLATHMKEAKTYYETLIKRFPNSQFFSESHRSLGEISYNKRDYAEAIRHYEVAARFINVPSYPRTLYKLAWSYFRVRRKTEALDKMKQAITASAKDEKFIALKEEAINDLVYFYADSGRFVDAKTYFASIGGVDVYIKGLKQLSKTYARNGQYRQSMALNEILLKEFGQTNIEAGWEVLLHDHEIQKKTGAKEGAGGDHAIQKLVAYYVQHEEKIRDLENGKVIRMQAKSFLKSKAMDAHKAGQKTKNPKDFSRAADLYSSYDRTFLKDPEDDSEKKEQAQLKLYLSDALLAARRDKEALPYLESTLKNNTIELKYRKEAGATLINYYLRRIDAINSNSKKDFSLIEVLEKDLNNVSEAFEAVFPEDVLVAELKYKKARIEVLKSPKEGLSSQARKSLMELIEKYPDRKESQAAAHDLVSDLLKKQQDDDAIDLSKKFLAMNALMAKGGELKTYLTSGLSRGQFKSIQDIEKSNDYKEAAHRYEKLARTTTDKEVKIKAYNNAAVSFEKALEFKEAFRIYLLINNKESLKRIATNRLSNSDTKLAGELYLKLAVNQNFSKEEKEAFTKMAVILYFATKQNTGADRLIESDRDFYLMQARALIDESKPKEAIALLKGYLEKKIPGKQKVAGHATPYKSAAGHATPYKSAEANFLLASVFESQADTLLSRNHYEAAAATITLKGRVKELSKEDFVSERKYAARAAFHLSAPLMTQFNAIKLLLPEEKLKANTRAKLVLIEKIVLRYQNIIAFGDGETALQAFSQIASAFRTFSQEIINAPVPARFEKYQALKQKYKDQLKAVAVPLYARAVEYLKQAHRKGVQLQLTSEVFNEIVRFLSEALPQEYPLASFSLDYIPLGLLGPIQETDKQDLQNPNHEWRKKVGAVLTEKPKNAAGWIELGNIEAISGRLRLAKLCFEQALAIDSKNIMALNNIAVILMKEDESIKAVSAFARAALLAEGPVRLSDSNSNAAVRLNYADALLQFKQFSAALEILRPLYKKPDPEGKVLQSYYVALVGSARWDEVKTLQDKLGAKGSKHFNLWYNWSVWAERLGESSEKDDALDYFKDRKDRVPPDGLKDVEAMIAMIQKRRSP